MDLLHLFLLSHRRQQNAIRNAQRFVAALPGRIALDRAAWRRCFPHRFLIVYLVIATFFGMGLLLAYMVGKPVGLWFLLGSAFMSVIAIQSLIDDFALAKAQCDRGCLVPATVLQVDPFLIAVYSDLSQVQDGSWPTIKIVKQPLERAIGPRPVAGDEIVALARYVGTPGKQRWDDFEAVAVSCITDNRETVQTAYARLASAPEDRSWQALRVYLAGVRRPNRPGLYIISRPESPNWLLSLTSLLRRS